MGWLFGWSSRKELAEHLISGNGVHTVKHCFKGNNLWAVQEIMRDQGPDAGKPIRFIALYMLKGRSDSRDGWGYKDLDESAGPYYYTCPVSYLDMVPDPGGYATEWRKKVRERGENEARKFSYGQRIKYLGTEYEVVGRPYRCKRDLQVKRIDTGETFRLPARYRKHIEV